MIDGETPMHYDENETPTPRRDMSRWNYDDLYDRALDIIAAEADVPRSEVDCEHMQWWFQMFAKADRECMLADKSIGIGHSHA